MNIKFEDGQNSVATSAENELRDHVNELIEEVDYDMIVDIFDYCDEQELGKGYCLRLIDSDRIWDVGVELYNEENDYSCSFLFDFYACTYSDLIECGGVFESMVHDINAVIKELNESREAA